jgi:serine protease Do
MKVSNWIALAGAVALTAVMAPVVHGQTGDTWRAIEVGRGARIGASVSSVDSGDSKEAKAGVSIETVDPGAPADKAGVKAGDIVTDFDGERVRSVRQFTRLVQETTPGHSVPVVLSRAGQRVTVNITPERSSFGEDFNLRLLDTPLARLAVPPTPPMPLRPTQAPPAPRAPRLPTIVGPGMPFELFGARSTGRLGITIESLDTQLAEYFGVKEGVLVKSVAADSVAARAGLKAGDVITSVNGRKVYDPSDVTRAIDRTETNGEITIEVTRDKKTQTLKGKLEARETRLRARVRTIV